MESTHWRVNFTVKYTFILIHSFKSEFTLSLRETFALATSSNGIFIIAPQVKFRSKWNLKRNNMTPTRERFQPAQLVFSALSSSSTLKRNEFKGRKIAHASIRREQRRTANTWQRREFHLSHYPPEPSCYSIFLWCGRFLPRRSNFYTGRAQCRLRFAGPRLPFTRAIQSKIK